MLTAALFAFTALTVTGETDILVNGGFESTTTGFSGGLIPAGWTLSKSFDTLSQAPLTLDSAGCIGLDSSSVHSGSYCLKMSMLRSNPDTNMYHGWEVKAVRNLPPAAFTNGATFTVNGFTKCNMPADTAWGVQIALFTFNSAWHGSWNDAYHGSGVSDWTAFSGPVTITDTGSCIMAMLIVLQHGIGDLWVDGLEVLAPTARIGGHGAAA